MESEFSNLKKTKFFTLFFMGYGIIFLVINYLLQYYEVSFEIIKIIRFALIIYAVMIGAFSSINFNTKISHKIFQFLLLTGGLMMVISVISIGKTASLNRLGLLNEINWLELKNLPTIMAGSFILFCSIIGQAGTSD